MLPLLLLLLLEPTFTTASTISVAKMFSSGMVLQEGPQTAWIFGTYTGGVPSVSMACDSGISMSGRALVEEEGRWRIPLGEEGVGVPSRSSCNITVESTDSSMEQIVLSEVLFGDVWFCAGQSNMGWVLGGSENHTEELEEAKAYNNIRFYRIESYPSSTPQYDLQELRNGWVGWNNPSSEWPEGTEWEGGHYPRPLADMSAICFLYGRELSDHLGNKPIGLITTAYAGTRIEAWSSPAALETCGIEDFTDDKHPWNSNSYLYNGMVAPLHRMTIKGGVWYQGESSSSWHPDTYLCTLPTMLAGWRQAWAALSGTSTSFPVGVVQVGPWAHVPETRDDGALFPLIRWHQTLDYGYLPNPEDPNTFLALTLDTYRENDGAATEHPNNKQLPAKRLGWAALNVVYGMDQFPAMGPFPLAWASEASSTLVTVTIDYTEHFHYLPVENSGFFFCCSQSGSGYNTTCDGDTVTPATAWSLLPMDSVTQTLADQLVVDTPKCDGAASLAYLWAESPVSRIHGLPIYGLGRWDQPGMPWWTWVTQA